MPKLSKNTRRYKKRSTKGGCGCQQKGGYSLKKLSIKKSIKKSLKHRKGHKFRMKGGLGGVANTSLDFGTIGGAATTAGIIGGTPLYSGADPSISASTTAGGNNANSLPMV